MWSCMLIPLWCTCSRRSRRDHHAFWCDAAYCLLTSISCGVSDHPSGIPRKVRLLVKPLAPQPYIP
jgi:hypothetical protein